ncbi:MAG: hypothetical protein JO142_02145 [Burkholderiales bacterium]|nr:hypothetical protein [Burkholderiales bacterium]
MSTQGDSAGPFSRYAYIGANIRYVLELQQVPKTRMTRELQSRMPDRSRSQIQLDLRVGPTTLDALHRYAAALDVSPAILLDVNLTTSTTEDVEIEVDGLLYPARAVLATAHTIPWGIDTLVGYHERGKWYVRRFGTGPRVPVRVVLHMQVRNSPVPAPVRAIAVYAEKDIDAAQHTADIVAGLGYEVRAFESATMLMRTLAAWEPDAIIATKPDSDLARRIASAARRVIPIIMFGDHSLEDSVGGVFACAANTYAMASALRVIAPIARQTIPRARNPL